MTIKVCFLHSFRALYENKLKSWTSAKDCAKSPGLTTSQEKLCKDHLDLMSTVTMATFNGIDACQKTFFDRRWNCSSLTKVPKLTKDLKRGRDFIVRV